MNGVHSCKTFCRGNVHQDELIYTFDALKVH